MEIPNIHIPNIQELLNQESESDLILESEKFIIHEKNKINEINENNIKVLNHLKKFIELLDKIESSLISKAESQFQLINDLKSCSDENSNLIQFQTINDG
jgi:hypothetical protein